ncbi:hypothetical protein ATCC90586_006863 [Pythium insidiosum]|nr:hypothetical protein ATCC90586_006863 [Pythium insidiosum]
MSAMKMEFICKDSPETKPTAAPATSNPNANPNPNANAKLSVLLNRSTSLGDSEPERMESDDLARAEAAGPPRKKAKTAPADSTPADSTPHTDGDDLSDHENSEEEQVEYAPWEDVDLNPAVDVVSKVVRECLEAGKTYNKSITAKTSQLVAGCDNVLLELKSLSEAREASRKQTRKQQGGSADGDCSCGVALGLFPLVGKADPVLAASQADGQRRAGAKATPVDEIAEDQTDRALFRIEASVERLRELAELIQATSMQGEANLIAKATLPEGAIKALHTAVQASAAAATAAAIAQERGRLAASTAHGRLYAPLQVKKLQEWYYSYPRPLTDELTLMRTILNYRPFANPFVLGGLTIAHVRDWFKRRRYRERVRYVKLAVEAGRDAAAAEEEIDLRIERRIEHLRATVDPNELVRELDKVRAESSKYDSMISSFARPEVLDTYISASLALPTAADQLTGQHSRVKRQRTQDTDLDDAIVVKVGNQVEISVLQTRMRSLLAMSRSATNTNALQQVIDVLRAMDISRDVRIQTGLVADLKKILKVHRKPTLLRKSTIALLESLGMNRRVIMDENAHDEAPPRLEAPPMSELAAPTEAAPSSSPTATSASPMAAMAPATSPSSSKLQKPKKEKGKIQRPMKFSMKQVKALEAWFQQKYKPTQAEMEGYLDQLNSPPLRDEKQPVDVNMTQLRRWFNKRRCLRRPPFALMTQQDAEKEGAKSLAGLAKADDDRDGDDAMSNDGVGMDQSHESGDNSNDDSSDDDDDDSSDDE